MMIEDDILAIAARGQNNEIGHDSHLPWHYDIDVKRFRRLTLHDTVLVGRKTYKNLPELDKRKTIVLSETLKGVDVYDNLNEALTAAKRGQGATWIIGGESVYEQTLDLCSHLALTEVPNTYPEADAYFPELGDRWKEVYSMPTPDGLKFKVFCQPELI